MLKGKRVHARCTTLWPEVDVGHKVGRLAKGQDAQGGVEEHERMAGSGNRCRREIELNTLWSAESARTKGEEVSHRLPRSFLEIL